MPSSSAMRIVAVTARSRDPRAHTAGGQLGSQAVTDQEPPLDPRTLDELRVSVGDDPAFVAELIDEFIAEAPGQLRALREAAATCGVEEARRAAHTLKGNARTFGAEGLASLCLEAETAAAAADLESVRDRLDALEAEWDRVRVALGAARDP